MYELTSLTGLDALAREFDVLIRACYPLVVVNTFEDLRFRRLLTAADF